MPLRITSFDPQRRHFFLNLFSHNTVRYYICMTHSVLLHPAGTYLTLSQKMSYYIERYVEMCSFCRDSCLLGPPQSEAFPQSSLFRSQRRYWFPFALFSFFLQGKAHSDNSKKNPSADLIRSTEGLPFQKTAATYSPTFSSAVPSALRGLTSLFGMGRGGSPVL